MANAARASDGDKEPWERENPRAARGEKSKQMSATQKASAKRHANAAGRPYPNLVDNMQAGGSMHKKK